MNLSALSSTATFTPKLFSLSSSFFNGNLRILFPRKLSSVVMMAKRDEELKEIRYKSTIQINDGIIDLKGDLFMLRLQKFSRNEFKFSEFRRMRKKVSL